MLNPFPVFPTFRAAQVTNWPCEPGPRGSRAELTLSIALPIAPSPLHPPPAAITISLLDAFRVALPDRGGAGQQLILAIVYEMSSDGAESGRGGRTASPKKGHLWVDPTRVQLCVPDRPRTSSLYQCDGIDNNFSLMENWEYQEAPAPGPNLTE